MNEPFGFHQTAGLTQLAEVKRAARCAPLVDAATDEKASCPEEVAAGPSPWQFRLRTMLGLVAGLSGLFAIMHVIGAVWSAILVWFLLLAIAHVTANFWGTRIAPRESRGAPASDSQTELAAPAHQPTAATGAVRLSESRRPGWPMLVTTVLGVFVGGTLGSIVLVFLCFDGAGYAGVTVGTVSAAVVGGFLGFLTSSFAEIALRAWKEALSGGREE